MKTLMQDSGLTVSELEDGRYLVLIERQGASIERFFYDYDTMQAWCDDVAENIAEFDAKTANRFE